MRRTWAFWVVLVTLKRQRETVNLTVEPQASEFGGEGKPSTSFAVAAVGTAPRAESMASEVKVEGGSVDVAPGDAGPSGVKKQEAHERMEGSSAVEPAGNAGRAIGSKRIKIGGKEQVCMAHSDEFLY